MLIDPAVDRRIRENFDIDTRAVDILKPRVMVPRRQRRLRPNPDKPLRVLAEFDNVGIITASAREKTPPEKNDNENRSSSQVLSGPGSGSV
jgi:hypothetical protein